MINLSPTVAPGPTSAISTTDIAKAALDLLVLVSNTEDAKARIESMVTAKQELDAANAEAARLEASIIAERTANEQAIESVAGARERMNTDLAKKRADLDEFKRSLDEKSEDLERRRLDVEAREAESAKEKSDLDALAHSLFERGQAMNEQEVNLVARENSLAASEAAHQDRVEKLKALVT